MYFPTRSFHYSKGKFTPLLSDLILEAPLEIIINKDRSVLIMHTPDMTRELVTGFVFTDGLIEDVSDMSECIISTTEKGELLVQARVSVPGNASGLSDRKGKRISYSSCGICGKEAYLELKTGLGRVKSRQRFSMEVILSLPERITFHQPLYHRTGGAHAAFLLDEIGNLLIHCEDMGRHNALDKVIGASLIKKISLEDKILLSSGRASLEMILKTARAGAPLFVAMSRPTSRAVEAAKFYNITLVDIAKGSNRIYSHARRIEGF